jgi:hypothetical protein
VGRRIGGVEVTDFETVAVLAGFVLVIFAASDVLEARRRRRRSLDIQPALRRGPNRRR